MKVDTSNPIKGHFDKTDWKKIIELPEGKADSDNPDLSNKKFKKSVSPGSDDQHGTEPAS